MLDSRGRGAVQPKLDKVADVMIKYNFTAKNVTVIALIIGLLSAVAYSYSSIVAVILLWVSGALDALDGTIARKTNTSSKKGAMLDIVFDRIVEMGLVTTLAIYNEPLRMYLIILQSCILISMTVFLLTAQVAENTSEKSYKYQAGLAERTEGFIMFSLMMLFTDYNIIFCVIFIVMIVITIGQRVYELSRIKI